MSTAEEEAAAKAAAEADAKPITMADFKKLFGDKDLATVVNSAAATHAKRAEEKFAKQLAAAREEDRLAYEAKLEEIRKTAAPKLDPKPQGDGGGGNGGGASAQPKLEDHPEFQAMRKAAEAQAKELERLQKKQQETAAREAEAVEKRRKQNLRSTTEDALSKHVAPGRASHARAFLTHPDNNRITYEDDDSDALVFITDDGDKVPLEKGLKAWLKTDDAKHYLPPLNPGGSGGGPGLGRGTGPADQQTGDLLAGINRTILGRQ